MPSRLPPMSLPRGTRIPAPDAIVRWHQSVPATFDIGRELLALDGAISIGLYDAPRSIIDAFECGPPKATSWGTRRCADGCARRVPNPVG